MDEKTAAAAAEKLWRSPKAQDGNKVGVANEVKTPAAKSVPFKDAPEEKNARVAPASTAVTPPPEEDNTPAEIVAMRKADKLRGLWNPQKVHEKSITAEDLAQVEITPGVFATPAQAEVAARKYREILSDLDLSPEDARTFVDLALRGSPSPELEAEWIAANEDMGYDENDVRLAQQLVNRDPRLSQVLRDTRLANHPAVIAAFVEKARFAKANGTLK
jgi:hypothetical protein